MCWERKVKPSAGTSKRNVNDFVEKAISATQVKSEKCLWKAEVGRTLI